MLKKMVEFWLMIYDKMVLRDYRYIKNVVDDEE